jgi:hypothetical protein
MAITVRRPNLSCSEKVYLPPIFSVAWDAETGMNQESRKKTELLRGEPRCPFASSSCFPAFFIHFLEQMAITVRRPNLSWSEKVCLPPIFSVAWDAETRMNQESRKAGKRLNFSGENLDAHLLPLPVFLLSSFIF